MNWKRWQRWFWLSLRLTPVMVFIALVFDQGSEDPHATSSRVLATTRGYTFNYVEWEVEALLSKLQQELFGYQAYLPEDERKRLVLDYFALQNRLFTLQSQIEGGNSSPDLRIEIAAIQQDMRDRQPLVEHIIEGQVSSVLRDEGFALLGQVLPPVTMHFLEIPDVLVVSPREAIRQEMTVTLDPLVFDERVTLEQTIAEKIPDKSVWITPVGGVGIYPSMVQETDRPTVAFEITAHEWLHHYLILFPLGLEYFSNPETRIINETSATLFGNEIGNKVIERFYAQELAAGQVYLQDIPDYRVLLAGVEGVPNPDGKTDAWNESPFRQVDDLPSNRLLADYLLSLDNPLVAQIVLDLRARQAGSLGQYPPTDPHASRPDSDQRGWIHHSRVAADYLLSLGMVAAAESVMETGRQHSGLRVLNQAWFAFNAGYQANPVIQRQPNGSTVIATEGGGGDPIGAAIYELRARSDNLEEFMSLMRGITTRDELLATLAEIRQEADE